MELGWVRHIAACNARVRILYCGYAKAKECGILPDFIGEASI